MTEPKPIRRIILGAGTTQRETGAWHQDILELPGIDIPFDLNDKKWPIADNSFESVIACHVVEHLKDLLNFMNECHRILAPGGTLYIETPNAGGNVDLEFADPTHVRCYRPHTWINYMTVEGVAKFRYTDKCWGSLHIGVVNGVIIIHTMPIK